MASHHPDLSEAFAVSSDLINHIRNFDLSRLLYRAAVIDEQLPPPDSYIRSSKGKAPAYKGKTEWAQTEIIGWNKFVQGVERIHAGLEQQKQTGRSTSTDQRDSPLPPVLASLTLWKTVCTAASPITGVRARMGGGGDKGKGKGKEEGVVDVIARGGAEWIKLWTEDLQFHIRSQMLTGRKKESQLLAEFREQDSYITSDWSDSDSDSDFASASQSDTLNGIKKGTSSRAGQPQGRSNGDGHDKPQLTNSLIITAKSLLSLAKSIDRPPGTVPPSITIRLTRLDPNPPNGYADARIAQTLALLRKMGVNLQFGDLSTIPLSALESSRSAVTEAGRLLPSLKVNLDPTALVGLCCDGLHHALPADAEEARRRYFRPRRYLHEVDMTTGSGQATPCPMPPSMTEAAVETAIDKLLFDEKKGEQQGEAWWDGYDDHRQSQHSRQLFNETMEEMRSPLICELRDTLEEVIKRQGASGLVEFWATEGALRHLNEAMGNTRVVGQGMEQQRMRRLIGLEEGSFWEGSRYEGKAGCLEGIKPRIFPEESSADQDLSPSPSHSQRNLANPTSPALQSPMCPEGMRSLHHSTAATCDTFLKEYHAVLANPSLLNSTHSELPVFLRPDRLPVPKVAELSVPLPIVSLESMRRGAQAGMTTLCMGNVVWRELFMHRRWKVRGWTQGNWEIERKRIRRDGDGDGREDANREEAEEQSAVDGLGLSRGEADAKGSAVVWLMPYRSLGEGKRVRFERGDYSFPVPK